MSGGNTDGVLGAIVAWIAAAWFVACVVAFMGTLLWIPFVGLVWLALQTLKLFGVMP